MNRADRRALQFGRAFSSMREYYQPKLVPQGLHAEAEAAWNEYCLTSACSADRDRSIVVALFGDCFPSDNSSEYLL